MAIQRNVQLAMGSTVLIVSFLFGAAVNSGIETRNELAQVIVESERLDAEARFLRGAVVDALSVELQARPIAREGFKILVLADESCEISAEVIRRLSALPVATSMRVGFSSTEGDRNTWIKNLGADPSSALDARWDDMFSALPSGAFPIVVEVHDQEVVDLYVGRPPPAWWRMMERRGGLLNPLKEVRRPTS